MVKVEDNVVSIYGAEDTCAIEIAKILCAFKKVLYKNYSKEEAEIKYGAVLATADAFSYISCKQEKKENAETDKKIGLDEILYQLILDSLDAIVKKGDK